MPNWTHTDFAHLRRPLWRRVQTWWASFSAEAPTATPPPVDQDTVWRELRQGLVFIDPADDLPRRWDLEDSSCTQPATHHPLLGSHFDSGAAGSSLIPAGPDFTSFDPARNPYVGSGIAPLDPSAPTATADAWGSDHRYGLDAFHMSAFPHDD